jgi:hypothetical protein
VLFPDAAPDDRSVIVRARERVTFERQGDYSFRVGVTDTSPTRAADALNAMLDAFLASEALVPRRRVEGERQFFADRLAAAQEVTRAAAAELRAFNEKNVDTLPEAREALVVDLERAKSEVALLEQAKRSAQSRIDFLGAELESSGTGGAAPPKEEVQALLQRRRQFEANAGDVRRRLALERRKYKDDWPSVKGLIAELKSIEDDIAVTTAAIEAKESLPDVVRPPASAAEGDAVRRMRVFRAQAEDEIRQSEAALKGLAEARDRIQQKITSIPFTDVKRRPLVERVTQAEARAAELQRQLDRSESLVDFLQRSPASQAIPYLVEQRAVPPSSPSGPARVKTMVAAIGIGIGIGYGLTLLGKRFKPPIVDRPFDLADLVGDALVVTIPRLPAPSEGTPRRRLRLGRLVPWGYAAACVGLATLAWGTFLHWWPAPSWLDPLLEAAR